MIFLDIFVDSRLFEIIGVLLGRVLQSDVADVTVDDVDIVVIRASLTVLLSWRELDVYKLSVVLKWD
jgi:hypothetical protein